MNRYHGRARVNFGIKPEALDVLVPIPRRAGLAVTALPKRIPRELEAGTSLLALTGTNPIRRLDIEEPVIPVAIAQPRNTVPLFARRFDRAMTRSMTAAPYNGLGLLVILGWAVAFFVAVMPLVAVCEAWRGAAPFVVKQRSLPSGRPYERTLSP